MMRIANDMGKNSSDKPLEILLRLSNDIFDSDTFSKIFYGLSKPPKYPENLKSQRESLDSNYRLIKDVALRLKEECENVSFQNEKRGRILWALIHFYFMPYNYQDDFAFAVDLAKSLDRQDFPPNLDWMYKRIHGEY